MEISDALQNIELKYKFNFKDKQITSIKSIVERKDTFIVLPTGYGKTKIYAHLPEIYKTLNFDRTAILVISPLQSLMLNQVDKLRQIDIKATVVGECQADKTVSSQIMNGEYDIVFSSPEAALSPGHWRKCFTTGDFHENIQAVIVDEAHCITKWGGEFREDYGKLSQLRSIVANDTTFVALTATATRAMKKDILKKLDMDSDSVETVYSLPDRPNITYYVQRCKKSLDNLHWVLNDVKDNHCNAKKTVIYCRNIATCATLYEHSSIRLP